MGLYDDMEQVLLSQQQIREKVEELGAQISQDYAGKEPVLVSVLKGAFIFMADLCRATPSPVPWTLWPYPVMGLEQKAPAACE